MDECWAPGQVAKYSKMSPQGVESEASVERGFSLAVFCVVIE